MIYSVDGVLHADGTFLLYATIPTSPDPTHCAVSVNFSGSVTGTGCDKASQHFSNSLGFHGDTTMLHACAVPTGETKPIPLGWGYKPPNGGAPAPATAETFQQNLIPVGECIGGDNNSCTPFNWGGRTISETSPASPAGSDTCYYPNTFGIKPQTTVTGGYITLDPGTQYKDVIGSDEAVVLFYRGQLDSHTVRTPCGYQVTQQMTMLCSSGEPDGPFKKNIDSYGIGSTNVTAIRGPSDKAERFWAPAVTQAFINQLLLDK